MAVDVATFVAQFPEFKDAPPTLVSAKLASALLLCPACPWGELQQDGVFYYTARWLALSPFARKMALVAKDKNGQIKTQYDDDLMRLKRMVTAGFRVT